MYKTKNKLKEVTITGISDWKPSRHGGRYRQVYAEGLDPASLYENMDNFKEWNELVKKIKPGKKLYCHAEIKSKGYKSFINCDTVPTILDQSKPPSLNKHNDSPSDISGFDKPLYKGKSDINTILEIDRKLEMTNYNLKTRVIDNTVYEIYGPKEWIQIQKV